MIETVEAFCAFSNIDPLPSSYGTARLGVDFKKKSRQRFLVLKILGEGSGGQPGLSQIPQKQCQQIFRGHSAKKINEKTEKSRNCCQVERWGLGP